jgi:hypothetical protein
MLERLKGSAKLGYEAIVIPKDAHLINGAIIIKAENENVFAIEPQAAGGNAHERFRLGAEDGHSAGDGVIGCVPCKRLHSIVEVRECIHEQTPNSFAGLLHWPEEVVAQRFEIHLRVFSEKAKHTIDVHFLVGGKEFNARALLAENVGGFLLCKNGWFHFVVV